MYLLFLAIHSWTRWLLVLGAIALLIRSALRRNRPYTFTDQIMAISFFWILNLQFLLGLMLYFFLSPITHAAFSDLSAAFDNPVLRFFLIEHPVSVLLAIGAAHTYLAKTKRAIKDHQKHRYILIAAGVCLFFILLAIPWPFLCIGSDEIGISGFIS